MIFVTIYSYAVKFSKKKFNQKTCFISISGGYIFSVVNPLETIVQLGVHLSPVLNEFMNITLYYTDPSYDSSRELYAFEIPYTKEWFNFAFKVLHDTLVFYLDCDEFSTVKIKRQPTAMSFDSASTLFVGQAGPKLRGNIEGSFQFLKIYGNPVSHLMRSCIKPDFVSYFLSAYFIIYFNANWKLI